MIRLDSLRTFGLTADPTWDNIPTTFWSTLETTTAIFCACMPAIRAGLVRLFPKVTGTVTRAPNTSFKPGTVYARKVPSQDTAAKDAFKRETSSLSLTAYDYERNSESGLVTVISPKAIITTTGKPDVIRIYRHTTPVNTTKPLPPLPDFSQSYG